VSTSNSPSPGPADPEQIAAEVATDPTNLQSITSKKDDTTSIHSNNSLPPATDNSSEDEGDSNDKSESENESSLPQVEEVFLIDCI
jgi:hypothetical protein